VQNAPYLGQDDTMSDKKIKAARRGMLLTASEYSAIKGESAAKKIRTSLSCFPFFIKQAAFQMLFPREYGKQTKLLQGSRDSQELIQFVRIEFSN
jgi:hypothetical protein